MPVRKAITQLMAAPVITEGVSYGALVDQVRDNRVECPSRLFGELDKVFGWQSANPSDPSKVELLKELFTQDEEVPSRDGGTIVQPSPVARAAREFRGFLESGPERFAEVVGRRGSGKTALTNYVLTINHRDLQLAHTTWLRADIAKLHAINEERFRFSRKPPALTVSEYMALHAFSVILNYSKDTVFEPAFGREATWSPHIPHSPFEAYLTKTAPRLVAKWQLVRLTEQRRKQHVETKVFSTGQDQDLKWYFGELQQDVSELEACQLFRAAWDFVATTYKDISGVRPRLILLFDGVDNLRADEHAPRSMWLGERCARAWYLDYLRELTQYRCGGGHCLPFDRCVFVLRDDTATDFGQLLTGALQQRPIPVVRRFEIVAPDIRRMVQNKLKFWRDRSAYWDVDGPSSPSDESLSLFRWFFDEFCSSQISALRRSLSPRGKALSERDVLDIVFNGNVRSFSRNLIRSFQYLQDYADIHPSYQQLRSKDDRLEFFKQNRSLIFEDSVVGGSQFMRLNFDEGSKGRWCPNFFEFEVNTTSRWDGLVLLRVLQSCSLRGSTRKPIVMRAVQGDLGILGYSEHCVQVGIYTALEYGLLCLGGPIRDDESDSHPLALFKTAKGALIERLIFQDAAALYLIATGAKFDGTPAEPPARIGNQFVHRRKPPRLFHASMIRTVCLVCRHLRAAHDRDMLLLNRNLPDDETGEVSVEKKMLRDRYILPPMDTLVEQLDESVSHGEMHVSERTEIAALLALDEAEWTPDGDR